MSPLETTFRFAHSYSLFALVVVCAALAVAGWWSLQREASFLSKRSHLALFGLRVLPFLVLIFLMLKPVLVYHAQSVVRQHVAILVDESESMAISDKVFSRVQLESAAQLLGLRKERSQWPLPPNAGALPAPDRERLDQRELGLDEATVAKIKATTRSALVRRAFLRDGGVFLDWLRDNYFLTFYGFSDRLREIPFERAVQPPVLVRAIRDNGASTRLGTALQRVVQSLRGQPVAAIVLVSDGRNVGGIPPSGVAVVAGDARIPIYAVPVGGGGSRDIAVAGLIAESVVFKGDEFPVSAKIASRGYSGHSLTVVFECDGAEIETRSLALTGREQLVTFRHRRDQEGKVRVRISARARETEERTDNNAAEADIRVIDKKIKVLMVEEIPRWDYRYLRNALLRDPHVEVKVYLHQADPEVVTGDPLYLAALPATDKDLFEYDLLILGSLRPKFLRDEQMSLIERFVAKMGGGVIFMASENVSPSLWAGTLLEALLPVRLTRTAGAWLDADRLEPRSGERRLELTDEGRRHALVRLEPESDRNGQVWREFAPHYWAAEVGGLKPAAQGLVRSIGVRDGTALPAIAIQPYGLGRVLYVGTDSTWRWRYKVGDRYFARFWGQAVQFLTLNRLLGQNKRLQIVADRNQYEAGQTASLSVRALDASFQPRQDEEIVLRVEDQTGKRHDVRGYLERDREGVYSAAFAIPYEGHFVVTAEDGGETARLEFDAERARLEMRDPRADWAAMAELAERSGGRLVALDHLDELPRLFAQKQARFTDRREQAMWDWPPFLIVFVLLKAVELALRKYWYLK